jgi:hypothetical protein
MIHTVDVPSTIYCAWDVASCAHSIEGTVAVEISRGHVWNTLPHTFHHARRVQAENGFVDYFMAGACANNAILLGHFLHAHPVPVLITPALPKRQAQLDDNRFVSERFTAQIGTQRTLFIIWAHLVAPRCALGVNVVLNAMRNTHDISRGIELLLVFVNCAMVPEVLPINTRTPAAINAGDANDVVDHEFLRVTIGVHTTTMTTRQRWPRQ